MASKVTRRGEIRGRTKLIKRLCQEWGLTPISWRFEFQSFSVGLCVAGRFGRRLLPAGIDLLLCEFQIVLSESPVGL